jgi:hypothetical protein
LPKAPDVSPAAFPSPVPRDMPVVLSPIAGLGLSSCFVAGAAAPLSPSCA